MIYRLNPRFISSFRRLFASDARSEPEKLKKILALPLQYLRQSDTSNYDPVTYQRKDVVFDEVNGKPQTSSSDNNERIRIDHCEFSEEKQMYRIHWSNGSSSEFLSEWVEQETARWKSDIKTDRILWRGLSEADVRSSSDLKIQFKDILTKEGMHHAIRSLYFYGILLVQNTPISDKGEGVAALGAALGGGAYKNQNSLLNTYLEGNGRIQLDHGTDGPLRTLYGTVWSTTSSHQAEGASVADSAYGKEALPLHTDMTYLANPPGLQIFCMEQPAQQGGESIFGDGFAAAEQLRQSHPAAFDTLSQVVRRYRCVDQDTGWHLEARGPVISTVGKRVVGIRHNDLDRLPDLPPEYAGQHDINQFYDRLREAHSVWDSILAQGETRLVIQLQAGDTIVVANQRCFHGRCSFLSPPEAPRAVRGCYVDQEELNSRFRMAGYALP